MDDHRRSRPKLTYYNHSLKVFLDNKATYYNEGVID